jgi:hypothetical protein
VRRTARLKPTGGRGHDEQQGQTRRETRWPARADEPVAALVPRVELHLFYNSLVFIPMLLGMYFHMFPPPREASRPPCAWPDRLVAGH